jgi:hypothetical protein
MSIDGYKVEKKINNGMLFQRNIGFKGIFFCFFKFLVFVYAILPVGNKAHKILNHKGHKGH